MSNNSRSRVTVTLGRSGRVVKRGRGVLEDGYPDVSMVGSERSVRDRLGGDLDNRNQHYDKRQRGRGESFGTSSLSDARLRKDDLRFKLMQKNMVRQSYNNDSLGNVDLRDKLSSSTSRPSIDCKTMRPPEASVSARNSMHEPVDAGITRNRVLNPRDAVIMGQTLSRNTHDLSMMNRPARYSSWTLDNLRRRSPERLLRLSASRGFSAARSRGDLQGRPLIRAYDEGRSRASVRMSPPRHVTSSPFLTRSALTVPPVTSAAPVPAGYPQASGMMQKIPPMGDEIPSVEGLLHSLGLDKYTIWFKAEEKIVASAASNLSLSGTLKS